jgi:hypothetical protein
MIFDASVPIITVKKSTVAFYKHASTITIHLMLDLNKVQLNVHCVGSYYSN